MRQYRIEFFCETAETWYPCDNGRVYTFRKLAVTRMDEMMHLVPGRKFRVMSACITWQVEVYSA